MVIGLGVPAGPAFADDALAHGGGSGLAGFGAAMSTQDLEAERAGTLALGFGENNATQDATQTVGDDLTVNAGNVNLGQNNQSLASTFVTNTGGPNVQMLGQTVVIFNITSP